MIIRSKAPLRLGLAGGGDPFEERPLGLRRMGVEHPEGRGELLELRWRKLRDGHYGVSSGLGR